MREAIALLFKGYSTTFFPEQTKKVDAASKYLCKATHEERQQAAQKLFDEIMAGEPVFQLPAMRRALHKSYEHDRGQVMPLGEVADRRLIVDHLAKLSQLVVTEEWDQRLELEVTTAQKRLEDREDKTLSALKTQLARKVESRLLKEFEALAATGKLSDTIKADMIKQMRITPGSKLGRYGGLDTTRVDRALDRQKMHNHIKAVIVDVKSPAGPEDELWSNLVYEKNH